MIYLASASPRRRRLLKEAGIRFRRVSSTYREEREDLGLSPSRLVKRHAMGKAEGALRRVRSGIIVGADTLVYHGGRLIGKPKSKKDAVEILSRLQGKWQTVFTGVALLWVSDRCVTKKRVFAEKTKVFIKPMSLSEIRRYLKRVHTLDKAGAYAIQSKRHPLATKFVGSYTNAVGLPMERLAFLKNRM